MSENHPYRPYANGVAIFIGVLILWAGSYGVFWLGLKLRVLLGGGDAPTE